MLTWMMIIMLGCLILAFPFMVALIAAPIFVMESSFPFLNKTILAQQTIGGVQPLALIAVPMFIFAADIMTAGRSADSLLNLVRTFVQHIRGGMSIVTAAGCTLFGAVSGSTQATVCAIGGPLRPKLLEAGYSSSFATALIINASDIAMLIPPSIGMIVYGVVTGTSVGEMFIAAVVPGLFILLLFSVYCYIYALVKGMPILPRASWAERFAALKDAALPLGFPVIIVGGIYAGIFSPTEAAVVSVFYAFFLEVVVYRHVKINEIPKIALSTGVVTSVVFVLVGVGTAFSWVISFAKIPQALLPAILGPDPTVLWLLLVISFSFFMGCMFVDPIVVIIILGPIFHPVAVNLGIDPVLVGVIVTLQVAIGSATPPFGCDIFTAIAIFRRPYWEVVKGSPPFLLILVIVNFTLIFFPSLALFLRDMAFH
jgi:tripartite ATP-independent transporter DctM subunit